MDKTLPVWFYHIGSDGKVEGVLFEKEEDLPLSMEGWADNPSLVDAAKPVTLEIDENIDVDTVNDGAPFKRRGRPRKLA